jgi:hypothetical protein
MTFRKADMTMATFLISALSACAPEGGSDLGGSDLGGGDLGGGGGEVLDFEALSANLLARMDLQPGERVLLVGEGGSRWDAIVPLLRAGVRAAGGVDLGAVDVRGAMLGAGAPVAGADPAAGGPAEFAASQGTEPEGWAEPLGTVDVAVKLPGAAADPALDNDVYRALQDALRGGRGRTVHFHWAGATSFEMEELAVDGPVDRIYQAAVLDTDYAALADLLSAFEAALRSGPVRVTTPAGTDISFEVGDRPVTRQDGDASAARAERARNLIDREVELPAGAARALPVLETVEGRIAFPPAQWGGERAEGVVLHFEAGRVVEVEADAGRDGVLREMEEAGEAGRTFRELGVGFNPLLAIPEGEAWIPYYGYGDAVARLSLGDNTELGGSVGGGYVRWNFFPDATVTVGSEAWVEGGRLVRGL